MEEIRIVGDPMAWARAHPTFFFNTGVATELDLAGQLVVAVRALGAKHVEVIARDAWSVVAAEQDWFALAKFQVPEEEAFTQIRVCLELGQNSIRPEGVLGAFAQCIVLRGPNAVRVVKGQVAATDPILSFLSGQTQWQRAIAFRGIEA